MDQFVEFIGNHPILFAAFGTVLLALIVNELHGNLRGPKRLSTAEAIRLINDSDAAIIDVRTPADFKKGHIINARNVPVSKLQEQKKELAKLKGRPVIVYCALGSVAASASDKLKAQGLDPIYVLKGGLNAWQGASLPVTSKA